MHRPRSHCFVRIPLYLYGAMMLVLAAGAVDAPGNRGDPAVAPARVGASASAGQSPYVVINVAAGQICLRSSDTVFFYAPCSAGSGGRLRDPATGRVWEFSTRPGVYSIVAKAERPLWHKPDWAYLEEGVPLPDDPAERIMAGELGEYSLKLGNGLYIHGTLYTRLLGMNVTHGCIRVGDDALAEIYGRVEIGTPVFIF